MKVCGYACLICFRTLLKLIQQTVFIFKTHLKDLKSLDKLNMTHLTEYKLMGEKKRFMYRVRYEAVECRSP